MSAEPELFQLTFAMDLAQLRPHLPISFRQGRGAASAAVACGAVVWFLFVGTLLSGKARFGIGIVVLALLALGALAAVHAGTLEVVIAPEGIAIRRWFGLLVRRRPLADLQKIMFYRARRDRWVSIAIGDRRLTVKPIERELGAILARVGAPER